ncbi:MAG: carboxypeptidase regulatory-like domain-containing protein [Gemmatimonadetes bacterium]|nr:carboxypeptidase regulatory-like domain-containing protein [Gemmatimonadota bacterium]
MAAACQVPETGAPGKGGGLVCTAIAVAGLNVTVTDSLSGAAIDNASVVASLTTGVVADSSMGSFGGGRYALLYERPGTYDVSVRANGYAAWRGGVVLGRDQCHVIPVAIAARLVKG